MNRPLTKPAHDGWGGNSHQPRPTVFPRDLGSFRPVYRESLNCDDCGVDTDTCELVDGVCPDCCGDSFSTLYARGGSVVG